MKLTHSLIPKPEHSVGDIFHRYGDWYDKTHELSPEQAKVLRTLSKCRTAALGGHLYECDAACGYEIPVYNSCRDRHCPLCQGIAMRKWLKQRMEELFPVPYYHTIFTMSHGFDILIPYNERLFYDALFEAASWSLDFMSRKYYGGAFGTTAVLHTWGQKLQRHVHLHCLVTGGVLSRDRKQWVPISDKYLFDVEELSDKFRDRFCHIIRRYYRKKLQGACQRIKIWIKSNRHLSRQDFFRGLNRRLRGHYNYYGVRGNDRRLTRFYRWAKVCAFKWLNRRGGKRSSFTWDEFLTILNLYRVPLPGITEKRKRRVFA